MTWQCLGRLVVFILIFPGFVSSSLGADDQKFQLLNPHISWDWVKAQVINQRLRELTGEGGINCGRVRIGEIPTLTTDCARTAFAAGKPFYVQYDVRYMGFSEIAIGFAFKDAKTAHAVACMRSQGNSRVGDDLTTVPCPMPITLKVTGGGRVTCFASDSQVRPSILSSDGEPQDIIL